MSRIRISRSSVVFEICSYDLPLLRTSRHKKWTLDAYGRGKKRKLDCTRAEPVVRMRCEAQSRIREFEKLMSLYE
jgi:hypothetical protein